ncbi:MAG: hypothetical protein DMG72_23445 [Acidobacteria bacterium]|nr:MAG: hypothetical protein DMG72_23445 [Acidobacteriota bacterium]
MVQPCGSRARIDQLRAAHPVKQRQLTASSSENGVTGGAISPDGKSLAYADLRGIHVQSIDTGGVHDLPEPESFGGSQVDWTIVPTWSRDSTKFLANAVPHGRAPSVWLFSLNGGPPRKLRNNAFAWTLSRDSSWVAFGANLSKLYYREMWLMRPDGDDAHKLYEADENNAFLGAEWSPDGQRLAYVNLYQGEDTNRLSIETRDLKGGPSVNAVSLPFGLADWTWSPDGRIITSFPDGDNPRAGTCNFWQTRVDPHTGKPLDKPKRLTDWSGFCMDQLSTSADGMRLTFRRSSTQSVIYIADLQANGNRMSTPRRLNLTEGRSYPAGWTADSNAVVFASDHLGQRGIFKQSLDTDTAEAVATDLGDRLPLPWGGGLIHKEVPRVSPDGAWILHLILPVKNGSSSPVRLVRIPAAGGPPQLVLTTSLGAAHSLHCARSPSKLCVIAELAVDRRQLIFTAFDVMKGRDREVARFPIQPTPDAEYAWDLSPEGDRIAILRRSEGTIHLLFLDSHASQEMPVEHWSDLQSVDWAADGKNLFVSALTETGSRLLQVDSRRNAHLLWKAKANVRPVSTPFMEGPSTPMEGHSPPWAVPSPDGRHLAICVWSTSANMWMMENF